MSHYYIKPELEPLLVETSIRFLTPVYFECPARTGPYVRISTRHPRSTTNRYLWARGHSRYEFKHYWVTYLSEYGKLERLKQKLRKRGLTIF